MLDDWKVETKQGLERSGIYQALKAKCQDDSAGSHVISLVEDATYYAFQRTKTIVRHMGEFTLHDGDHLFRVLSLMERLIPEKELANFNVPELMLLVLSAFFHDIGMAPDEVDVLAWKKVWDADPILKNSREKEEHGQFLRFCNARPDKAQAIADHIRQTNFSAAQQIKDYLITEYIRVTHADRARKIVEQDWNGRVKYRDVDLSVEFANLCFSHNEDAATLLEFDKSLLCGPSVYVCLPLVAVVLRLSDLLDFDAKRTPSVLFSHLFVRNSISVKEWNKHRAVEAWIIRPDIIQFHAKCTHPAVEASIREFCDVIDRELAVCTQVMGALNDFHASNNRSIRLPLPIKVDRSKIETKKGFNNKPLYIYRKTKFNLSKSQVIDLLMGTKLYGDTAVALRELIQNSMDACLLRQSMEQHWKTYYAPEITVKLLKENDQDILEVTDNGTGMDENIIDGYYSKVGSSFYKSTEFYDLRSQTNSTFTPTSRFGIGILSCFMVADMLSVETRRVYGPHESSMPLSVTVEGQESLFVIKQGTLSAPGTTTRLFLRKEDHPWKRMTPEKFITSVQNVVRNPPFKIMVQSENQRAEINQNSFNSITAESLKPGKWVEHENIREFHISLNDSQAGIVGSIVVGVIEHQGKPVDKIEIKSKEVEIEGVSYSLDKKIFLSDAEIRSTSSTISIGDNNEIKSSNSDTGLAGSISRLSLHGIDVAASLFPPSWEKRQNQATLDWPMPMLMVIDVGGIFDLDLNSARTQILVSDKWYTLEAALAKFVLSQICSQVSSEYWQNLKDVLRRLSNNSVFSEVLETI